MTGDAEPENSGAGRLSAHGDGQPLTVVQRVHEDLVVDVRTVETGRVRITTRVVDEPAEERVPLLRTAVKVERVVVDRTEDARPTPRFADGVIIVPLFEEILIVRYRVTGEIHVTEETTSTEKLYRETVRRTVAEIERLPPARPRAGDLIRK